MKRWLIIVFRFVLAAVFIYAGIGKIIDPAGFVSNIENYRLLPYFLSTLVAIVLPWTEVICGILLIWGKWLKGVSLIIVIMNVVFIVAIASAMARGLDIHCGCFSLNEDMSKVSFLRIFEDLIFMAMAIYVFIKTVPIE